MTDFKKLERKALEGIETALSTLIRSANNGPRIGEDDMLPGKMADERTRVRAAIRAYGRAVREADKEAARHGGPLAYGKFLIGRKDAVAAIESLEKADE